MAKLHKWTAEEDTVLVQAVKDKVPYKDIANIFNVTENAIRNRLFFLRKKGIDIPFRHLNWNEKLEKEVANEVSKNEGNLSQAFRNIAEKYDVNPSVIKTRWYSNKPAISIRDKYRVFGVFGRYRGAANRKNYSKKNSKGHLFWKMLKSWFV